MPQLLIAVGGSLVALWLALLLMFWVVRPKGVPVRELVAVVPDTLRLIRSLIVDRTVPLDVRCVMALLLIWIISPIDLIPEFIPVLGPIDDIVVAVAAMRFARRRVGAGELLRRWPGSSSGSELLARVIGSSDAGRA